MVKAALLCADNGMVTSADPVWIQSAFDTLTGMFDRVGLQLNVCNTMGMVCRTCQEVGVRSDKAYTRSITVERRIFKERH